MFHHDSEEIIAQNVMKEMNFAYGMMIMVMAALYYNLIYAPQCAL
jgi:hypothetical protein